MDRLQHWQIHGIDIDPLMVFAGLGGLALAGLIALIVVVWLAGRARAREALQRQTDARGFEKEVAELKGRLQSMAELAGQSQAELGRAIHERLDRVSQNLGLNLEETTRKTTENLSKLNERLAVIDTAQRNITELSTRVVSLQDILANKQQRGAFGQLRMETIIQDALPKDAYSFQATLSNGKRPDCLIHLPGSPPASPSTPNSRWSPSKRCGPHMMTPRARMPRRGCGPTSPATSTTSPPNTPSPARPRTQC